MSSSSRNVPIDPLIERIRAVAADHIAPHTPNDKGYSWLARAFAERFGESLTTTNRGISRILSRKYPTVSEETADRWCIVMGCHPMELWPDEWPILEDA